jgi:diadenosine tetraphosphate (Ap4A) HIT family hydrolase
MSADDTSIHRRVRALRAGGDPGQVARLGSGWVVLGDPQVIRGYCLLLPDPVVPQLNALAGAERARFLSDMALTGDVLTRVLGATRINYAIFGNQDPALHAHIFPRRADEPAGLVTAHPWAYDWTAAPRLSAERDRELIADLRRAFAAPR